MQQPGHTPCVRVPEWEQALRFDGVWVKDESHNPTGTFKDRRSAFILQHALEEKAQKLVLISAGNAAYSLAKYAEGTGVDVVPVVDRTLSDGIRKMLHTICSRVIEVDLSKKILMPEDLIALARTSPDEKILDVTNGFHEAYMQIVRELKNDLPVQPDCIAMPFGGGEAMVGVMLGVQEVGWMNGTEILGISNQSSERLRTSFVYAPYAEYLNNEPDAPLHDVMNVSSDVSSVEVRQNSVPKNIRAEEAPGNVFHIVRVLAKANRACFKQNLVLINSGYGKIVEEAERRSLLSK